MLGALLAKRTVRQGFTAMNRGDLEGVMALFADDAVLEYPGRSMLAGRYEGADAIRGWFVQRFARAERRHYTLTHVSVAETMTLGTTNTVLVEWLLTETLADGSFHHLSGVTSLHLHSGKVVHARDYVYEQDVVEAAWGSVAAAA